MLKMRAAERGGAAIGVEPVGALAEIAQRLRVEGGQRSHRVRLARREHENGRRAPFGSVRRGRGLRGFAQDDMGVRPAEPEGADCRGAPRRGARPWRRVQRKLEAGPFEADFRIEPLELPIGRDDARADDQRRLDEPRDARPRFEVPDARLDRAETAGPIRRLAVDRGQSRNLDRIAERRAGAVRLDVADLRGCHIGSRKRFARDLPLRQPVRRREAVAAPVLIDRRASNDGVHEVALAQCVRKAFEHDHAAAFAAHVAVRRRVESLAAAVARQHPGARENDAGVRSKDQVHAAREGGSVRPVRKLSQAS